MTYEVGSIVEVSRADKWVRGVVLEVTGNLVSVELSNGLREVYKAESVALRPYTPIGRASDTTRSDLDVWKTDIEDKVNENRSKKETPIHLKTTTVEVVGIGPLETLANGRIAFMVLRGPENQLIRGLIATCESIKPTAYSPVGFTIEGPHIDVDFQSWGYEGLNECWISMFRLSMATASYEYQEVEGEPDAKVNLEAIHSVFAKQCGLGEAINAYDQFAKAVRNKLNYDLTRSDRDSLTIEYGYMRRNKIKDDFMRAENNFQTLMEKAHKEARVMTDTVNKVQ